MTPLVWEFCVEYPWQKMVVNVIVDEGRYMTTLRITAPTAADAVAMFRNSLHTDHDKGRQFHGKDATIRQMTWVQPNMSYGVR
jgi:hypothetical protein